MNPTKYTCEKCGKASLEEHYHEINYITRPAIYLCDSCFFDKTRPNFDFTNLITIRTVYNEPAQLTLWGEPL